MQDECEAELEEQLLLQRESLRDIEDALAEEQLEEMLQVPHGPTTHGHATGSGPV